MTATPATGPTTPHHRGKIAQIVVRQAGDDLDDPLFGRQAVEAWGTCTTADQHSAIARCMSCEFGTLGSSALQPLACKRRRPSRRGPRPGRANRVQ